MHFLAGDDLLARLLDLLKHRVVRLRSVHIDRLGLHRGLILGHAWISSITHLRASKEHARSQQSMLHMPSSRGSDSDDRPALGGWGRATYCHAAVRYVEGDVRGSAARVRLLG